MMFMPDGADGRIFKELFGKRSGEGISALGSEMLRIVKVGSVPATFDPIAIKSTNWLYEPRAGDFRRDGKNWVVDKMLGPGDLEAVPGFVWDRQ